MLTPQDITNREFDKAVFGGYDIAAVDKFLEEVFQDYSALYRDNATLKSNGNNHVVHLIASTASNKIRELFITIDKKTNHPTQVKLLQGKKWTIFDISNLKKQSANDSMFRFNAKDFPHAEVIDLR